MSDHPFNKSWFVPKSEGKKKRSFFNFMSKSSDHNIVSQDNIVSTNNSIISSSQDNIVTPDNIVTSDNSIKSNNSFKSIKSNNSFDLNGLIVENQSTKSSKYSGKTLMSFLMSHIEKNFNQYKINFSEIDFNIFSIYPETYRKLGINDPIMVSQLPENLDDYTMYLYETGTSYHCIYHYKDGIIFNPDSEIYNLSSRYENIQTEKFEVNTCDYDTYCEFNMSDLNLSGISSIIQIETNSDFWCLMIAFCCSNNIRFEKLIAEIDDGPYKKLAYNKLHYLSHFMAYCYVLNL